MIPSSIANQLRRLLKKLGVRLMRASNCPQGTETKLYQDVLNYVRREQEPFVVLDVGANQGDFSRAILESVPEAFIHAFEPSPAVFEMLSQAVGRNSQISCNRQAMGAVPGSLPFEPRPDDDKLGRLVNAATSRTILVEVGTIDSLIDEKDIKTVALLKTDTEGHELDVLNGASKSLQAGKILSIFVEVTLGPATERHVSLDAVVQLLKPLGFHLFGIYDVGYDRHTGAQRFCNALFKHHRLLDAAKKP